MTLSWSAPHIDKINHACVSVYCRIRPLSGRDNDRRVVITSDAKTASLAHGGEHHTFAFDRIFDSKATQQDVFEGVRVSRCVCDVLGGYNATIFAYGQTASGKTHTMEGADIFHPLTSGVIPRAAAALFQACSHAPADIEFAIKVSFVEIYMERIRDLLDTFGRKRENLRIRENPNSGIYVAGCTETFVTNENELLICMTDGRKSRATAATGMNEGSSRSHSVLCITVQQRNTETEAKRVGKLIFVDLAGSEMARKSQAAGLQLEEAKNINRSLSALGQVINALTDEKKVHIPYRDSKLTRMLQDSLGGNTKTALIVTISASAENASETLSTLKFGQRAKAIKNKPKVNERKSVEELTTLLRKAEAAIDIQSAYINALELQVTSSGSEIGFSGTPDGGDAETMAAILRVQQQKILSLSEELAEEQAELKRCNKEALDLTAFLHKKEGLLLDARNFMEEVESKMGKAVRDQARMLAQNKLLVKAKARVEEKAQFRVRELELHLEKANAVDERLRKEDAEYAAISQGVSSSSTAKLGIDCESNIIEHPSALDQITLQRLPKHASMTKHAKLENQHRKLITDLSAQCELVNQLEYEIKGPNLGTSLVTSKTGQHMCSLRQRLEQLVAVHQQLLRKYAALELNLGEANKMIMLRNKRIIQLEYQSEKRYEGVTAECQRMSALMNDVDLKLLNKKIRVKQVLAQPRTLRGGQKDACAHARKAAIWWNNELSSASQADLVGLSSRTKAS